MVSINSNGNAIANWNSRNATGTTDGSGSTTAAEPTVPTAPSETTSSSHIAPAPIMTPTVEPASVYSPPARTEMGQAPVSSRSLDSLLSDAGFFSRSAAAEAPGSPAVEQIAASAMPAALSQAEVVARAAYAIVADASADSASSSLIKQFG